MSNDAKPKTRTKKHPATIGYSTYIYKVLKEHQEDIGITQGAMKAINLIMNDLFYRLYNVAAKRAFDAGRTTLTKEDVISAVSVTLRPELADHARSEINKATLKYEQSRA